MRTASRSNRRTVLAVLCCLVCVMGVSAPAGAAATGPVVALPARLATAVAEYLPGVVGDPVPAFTIDPAMASLSTGTRTYTLVHGDNAGQTEQHVVAPAPRDTAGSDWRYRVGNRSVFLKLIPGESLSVVSEQDTDQGVVTKYSPAEPLLIAGMNAGDTRTETVKVNVYDLEDPSDLEHQGTLNVTLTYVGAYRVTVPAGTYDAALLLWDFKGKIGPASVDDIQARLVAPGVGMVAAAEKRDIAAFLIYNDNSRIGRVLAQP